MRVCLCMCVYVCLPVCPMLTHWMLPAAVRLRSLLPPLRLRAGARRGGAGGPALLHAGWGGRGRRLATEKCSALRAGACWRGAVLTRERCAGGSRTTRWRVKSTACSRRSLIGPWEQSRQPHDLNLHLLKQNPLQLAPPPCRLRSRRPCLRCRCLWRTPFARVCGAQLAPCACRDGRRWR